MATKCPSIQLIMGLSLVVLIIILLWQRKYSIDGFGSLDIPSGNDLIDPPVNIYDAYYGLRKVLIYLKNNPNNSGEFLNFLKESFFTESAEFNPNINYVNVNNEWNKVLEFIKLRAALKKETIKIENTPDNAFNANQSFTKILSYLSKNPNQSGDFLNFFKTSFFNNEAQFNKNIDFVAIKRKWKGGTFRDKSTDV